jgi:hypothetical protein
MTLIHLLANDDQCIQQSARRFSGDEPFATDDGNKAAILDCKDARLAVSFCGLAAGRT